MVTFPPNLPGVTLLVPFILLLSRRQVTLAGGFELSVTHFKRFRRPAVAVSPPSGVTTTCVGAKLTDSGTSAVNGWAVAGFLASQRTMRPLSLRLAINVSSDFAKSDSATVVTSGTSTSLRNHFRVATGFPARERQVRWSLEFSFSSSFVGRPVMFGLPGSSKEKKTFIIKLRT